MLKILNTTQIKQWDEFTIKNEPIVSIDLMERACKVFVQWFTGRFDALKTVGIVCGTGNNGGDGLGIARMLHEWGYSVKVWIIKSASDESRDFKINKTRLPEKIECIYIEKVGKNIFDGCDILIDGIFGSGLSRPLEEIHLEIVNGINNSRAKIVAIDIPSGLFADKHTSELSVYAHYTVTFQIPKITFLLPETQNRVGEWLAVNIGLSKIFLKQIPASWFWVDKKWVARKIPKREKFAHKGNFGKALLIAGSFGKMGAAILSARAAMKSGVGLLTVHVPQNGYSIIQTAVPEAMASIDEDEKYFTTISEVEDFTAIGIGPGIGQEKSSISAMKSLLEGLTRPMVIDADGLNILASNRALQLLIPPNSILTPHPGEFQRLVGEWKNDFDKLEKAKAFAQHANCILVLKGANTTIVASDGRLFFNSTGNPGMATAGSGDVLSGVLTGLLAQKIDALDAAIIGVFIHGFAGDLAAEKLGHISLTASDIINALPTAFKQLSR